MNLRKACIMLLLTLAMSLLSGCSIASVFSNTPGAMSGRYFYYNGSRIRPVDLDPGQSLDLTYSVGVSKGNLALAVLDPSGNAVWEEEFKADSEGKFTYQATEAGVYKLVLTGSWTGGSYQVDWDKTK